MRYQRVFLDAMGYEIPPVVVTTRELEERLRPLYERLRIPVGQLEVLTGIRERRWWPIGARLSVAAAAAARKALSASAVEPKDLGAVVYCGVCREDKEPATACRVAAQIGCSRDAAVFDVSNACLGVLNGILEVANRIELGQIRAGLVVSCESAREIVRAMTDRMLEAQSMDMFKKALATLTGGAGAVAVLLTDGSFGSKRRRLLGGVTCAAPEHHELCRWGYDPMPGGLRPHMETDAVGVLQHGVELGAHTFEAFLRELAWTPQHVDKVICHQVGSAHQTKILARLGIPKERDFVTYPTLGNTGTVALPIAAAIAEEQGHLRVGDRVGFLGIGSGLNCLMLGWQW